MHARADSGTLGLTDAMSIASTSSAQAIDRSRLSLPKKQLTNSRSLPAGQGGTEVCTFNIEDTHMPIDLVELILSIQQRVLTCGYDTRARSTIRTPAPRGSSMLAILLLLALMRICLRLLSVTISLSDNGHVKPAK